MPIRVAIVEDNRPLREDLVRLLASDAEFICVAACGSVEEALARIPPAQPDVVLMDIGLPGMSGVEGVAALKPLLPAAQVMMLTQSDDPDVIFQAIAAGATGYLLKSQSLVRLLEAIRELHDGGSPITSSIARHVLKAFAEMSQPASDAEALSPREHEVLELLARGCRIKEVAAALAMSARTVDGHLQRIYLKLQVRNKAGAIAKFRTLS
jgi:DNA-binding NarL/FixJ family response regulator